MRTTNIKVESCDFDNRHHVEAVGRLINGFMADDMGGGIPHDSEHCARLVQNLKQVGALVLLAKVEDAFAGIIVAFLNVSTFHAKPMINVHDVYVSPVFRKQGVAQHLFESLFEQAKLLGACRLTLEVSRENLKAQRLYANLGFKDTEPPSFYWRKELL